ncbi:DUF3006 domain-containing protein [bacterium LRH843]|nr:DUF3006 domain-containing protein [bacterium LRH843]
MRDELYTVDRFEGELAVLLLRENETVQLVVKKDKLPTATKEGSLLSVQLDDSGTFLHANVKEKDTEDAKKKAEELLEKILKKNKA